jgi:hypothetical protein
MVLVRKPPRREVTEVFPSIVALVRTTPDYIALERTYWIEERETIEAPLWSSIEIMRRYPVRIRAEVECDAFSPEFISFSRSDSISTVTILLPRATLQPAVVDLEGVYRPEPDVDGLGADLIPAEERAEIISQYDALMEQNARTAAQDLAMGDELRADAEARTASDLSSAVLALLRARGFDDVEVIVVFGEAAIPPPIPDSPHQQTGG